MFGFFGEKRASDDEETDAVERKRPSLLIPTLKSVAIVALMSWGAAQLMSSTDRQHMAQLAGLASRGVIPEPTTTGSIASRANSQKLDPCVAPRR